MTKQYRTKQALYVDNFLYVVGRSTKLFTKQKIKYQYKTSYIKIKNKNKKTHRYSLNFST